MPCGLLPLSGSGSQSHRVLFAAGQLDTKVATLDTLCSATCIIYNCFDL